MEELTVIDGHVRVTDHREDRLKKAYDFGVWDGDVPRGSIKIRGECFDAYTNKREPGKSLVGKFDTLEEAARAVVAEAK